MTKKETLDKWCREKKPGGIPIWYTLKKVSRQGKFFYAYYSDPNFEEDTTILQYTYSEFVEHYRDSLLEDLMG